MPAPIRPFIQMRRLYYFSVGVVNPNLDGSHHTRYNVPNRPVALLSIILTSSIETAFAPGGPHRDNVRCERDDGTSEGLTHHRQRGSIRGVPIKVEWVYRVPGVHFPLLQVGEGTAVPCANHRDPDRLGGSAAVSLLSCPLPGSACAVRPVLV